VFVFVGDLFNAQFDAIGFIYVRLNARCAGLRALLFDDKRCQSHADLFHSVSSPGSIHNIVAPRSSDKGPPYKGLIHTDQKAPQGINIYRIPMPQGMMSKGKVRVRDDFAGSTDNSICGHV
jgi:hypothetical protein